MFVQISPAESDAGETLCSLQFASRVRGIELGPAKRQVDGNELFKYKQLVSARTKTGPFWMRDSLSEAGGCKFGERALAQRGSCVGLRGYDSVKLRHSRCQFNPNGLVFWSRNLIEELAGIRS